jgi:hypothetical protein
MQNKNSSIMATGCAESRCLETEDGKYTQSVQEESPKVRKKDSFLWSASSFLILLVFMWQTSAFLDKFQSCLNITNYSLRFSGHFRKSVV